MGETHKIPRKLSLGRSSLGKWCDIAGNGGNTQNTTQVISGKIITGKMVRYCREWGKHTKYHASYLWEDHHWENGAILPGMGETHNIPRKLSLGRSSLGKWCDIAGNGGNTQYTTQIISGKIVTGKMMRYCREWGKHTIYHASYLWEDHHC